jgi:hypothetical protein
VSPKQLIDALIADDVDRLRSGPRQIADNGAADYGDVESSLQGRDWGGPTLSRHGSGRFIDKRNHT